MFPTFEESGPTTSMQENLGLAEICNAFNEIGQTGQKKQKTKLAAERDFSLSLMNQVMKQF